jgi:hypothetical protein
VLVCTTLWLLSPSYNKQIFLITNKQKSILEYLRNTCVKGISLQSFFCKLLKSKFFNNSVWSRETTMLTNCVTLASALELLKVRKPAPHPTTHAPAPEMQLPMSHALSPNSNSKSMQFTRKLQRLLSHLLTWRVCHTASLLSRFLRPAFFHAALRSLLYSICFEAYLVLVGWAAIPDWMPL